MAYIIKVQRKLKWRNNYIVCHYIETIKYTIEYDSTYPVASYTLLPTNAKKIHDIREVRRLANKLLTRGDNEDIDNSIIKVKIKTL